MIKNVSFAGRLFLAGGIPHQASKTEVNQLKKIAKDSEYDVVVLKRDYYVDGTGVYDALLVREDVTTGNNIVLPKTFDFKSKSDLNVFPSPSSMRRINKEN